MPFFETADRTRLAYEDHGAGTPIVFIASWALGADMWEYQVPFFLDRGYRCVLPERRGHGRSDRPSGGYDMDTRADDLAVLLEHLDLTSATLVAHSAGGGEAVGYLARHGTHRVAALALVSTTLPALRHSADNPSGLPETACANTLAELRRVHGAADQSAPVQITGRRTAELVAGCRYREYPTAGHGLFVTHRDPLNSDLLALVSERGRFTP